jgi:hypothetical protein
MPVFSPADAVLILAVTGMAVGVAYLHSPRAKTLLYMLPIPFTLALISSGRGVDATHPLAFLLVWAFPWNVYLLHVRLKVPIVAADLVALVVHVTVSLVLACLVPTRGGIGLGVPEPVWFGVMLAVVLVAAGLALHAVPPRLESGHRSPLPPHVKVPIIMAVIIGIVLAKEVLRGFMPAFPMVTVIAVYEARKSLYTLAGRFPICLIGLVPVMLVLRVLVPYGNPTATDYAVGLTLGWAVYIPVYLLLNRRYNRPMAPG